MSGELLTRSGILKATLSAFLTWLSEEFSNYGDDALKVYLTRNITDMRQPGRLRKERASDEAPVQGQDHRDTVEYPMMRVSLGEISIDGERSGFKKNRANNGVIVGMDREQNLAYTDSMLPVKVSLGARIDTTDLDQLLIIAHMLLLANPKVVFTFLSESGTVPIETSVTFDPSLTIPQADLGSPGSPYSLETTFVMNTYIGVITRQRLIRSIDVQYVNPRSLHTKTLMVDKLQANIFELETMHEYDLFDRASIHYKYAPNTEST